MTARRRITLLVAAGLSASLLLAACSIGTDDAPRDLAVSTSTTVAPVTPTSGGATAVLYYVHDGQLVPITRSLPDRHLGTVLDTLLKAPSTDQQSRNLTTSIPVGTRLSSSRLDGSTLIVDLSSEFDNVVGPSRQQAIAQIVMTATEFPGVDRLRFSINGKPVQVATPTRGDTSVVSDCDYRSLLAKPSDIDGTTLGQATVQRLQLRQSNLVQQCPSSG
ncbi:MAG: GerMN domain-containing protein [Actinobacteria bacterium]|nr:GerMN domain-containing protein [Actinomycetota bacterium]